MSDTETGTATAVLDRDTATDVGTGPVSDPPDANDPPADLPVIEAAWMEPAELVIDENVRESFRIEDHPLQVASIKERGVKDPINAIREADGSVHAVDGQVRLLIALALEMKRVPVFIVAAPVGLSENERRIERVFDQINFNERRIPLTDADYAGGIALALDLGASVPRVAKALQTSRETVKANAKIGASPTAKALLETDQFSFDQLAVIGHYEALGDTEAVERLNKSTRSKFAHEVELILAERAAERAYLKAALPYGAYGFGILTTEPDTSSPDAQFVPAELLVTADDEPVTAELVNTDPARWVVYLHREENGQLVEKNTGAIVEPEAVDWDTQDNPDAAAAPGLLHADLVEHRDRWVPFCYLPADQLPDSGFRVLPVTAAPVDPSDDEDDAQTRAEANAEATRQAAAARAEARQMRARVEQLNIRGVAAAERRDGVLLNFLSRRTPHTAASRYVAESMANRLGMNDLGKTLHLLGVGGTRDALIKAIRAATPARAWVIVTAMIIAKHENGLDKSLWRNHTADTERYLHFLAEAAAGLDYTLSDVEQAAAGDIDYRDIDLAA
ncbi:ParB N-terminal domain-containing protein [Nocardia sp. NPDC006044]|uniref:ParB N-terminal domain-containing protein n=1 Tax=Nocardia sp. NPDC006044 TaxID=3364306 RepID=UPI0036B600FF